MTNSIRDVYSCQRLKEVRVKAGKTIRQLTDKVFTHQIIDSVETGYYVKRIEECESLEGSFDRLELVQKLRYLTALGVTPGPLTDLESLHFLEGMWNRLEELNEECCHDLAFALEDAKVFGCIALASYREGK